MVFDQSKKFKLKPLNITCKSTECNNNLHCFNLTKKMRATVEDGCCRKCGVKLVDRDRTKKRRLKDINYTFKALKYELWRHHYWHLKIDQKAINHAKRKGISGMRIASQKRIQTSVGHPADAYDGRQTKKDGNVLYYAQHATATCCRSCIEEWHGIPQNEQLKNDQIKYFAKLLMLYVKERLPYLSENAEYVPKMDGNS